MNPKLTETVYIDFVTSSPTTGAAIDADSLPTCEVFEDATDTAIVSPTVVKRTGKTGNYRVPVVCTAANGFEAAKSYNVIVAATVGAVAAKAVVRTFQMRTHSIDDISVSQGNGGTLRFDDIWKWTTAGSVSSGQIRGNVTDWNTITELWIHNVTNGGVNLGAYLLALKADDTIRVQQANDPLIWNSYLVIGAVVNMTTWAKVPVILRDSAAVSAPATATNCLVGFFRPNNLDWSDTEREQIRHRIGIDGTASAPAATPSLALQTTSTSIKTVTDKVDTALVIDGAVYQYTANALELGPAGGGGGGDASQATLLAVKAKTDALPSDPADASDIAASFATVNGTLSTISGYVDTEVAAIKAKTDNLPTDPASASSIAASFTNTNSKIDAVDDYVDTEVAAIKAKTDQLTFTGGKVDANATLAIAPTDLNAIADALLKRDWNSVTGEAAYSALNAFRMLRNAWNTTGGVLSVKKEDGTTDAWTRVLSTDASADPIIGAS